jgi:hypothetical protein
MDKITMTYLRTPNIPVWGYVLDANGRPQYDPSTSVDIESPDETHNDIAIRVLRYLGISIREMQLSQYAQAMNQEGV